MTGNSTAAYYETIIRLLVGPGSIFASRDNHLPINWVTPESVDWEQVWQIANRERVVPLLYQATRRVTGLPAWWQERCRAEYRKTGILNTLRFRELSGLLADLRSASVACRPNRALSGRISACPPPAGHTSRAALRGASGGPATRRRPWPVDCERGEKRDGTSRQ